MKFIVPTA